MRVVLPAPGPPVMTTNSSGVLTVLGSPFAGAYDDGGSPGVMHGEPPQQRMDLAGSARWRLCRPRQRPGGRNVGRDHGAAVFAGGVGQPVELLGGIVAGRQHTDVINDDQVSEAYPEDRPLSRSSWYGSLAGDPPGSGPGRVDGRVLVRVRGMPTPHTDERGPRGPVLPRHMPTGRAALGDAAGVDLDDDDPPDACRPGTQHPSTTGSAPGEPRRTGEHAPIRSQRDDRPVARGAPLADEHVKAGPHRSGFP